MKIIQAPLHSLETRLTLAQHSYKDSNFRVKTGVHASFFVPISLCFFLLLRHRSLQGLLFIFPKNDPPYIISKTDVGYQGYTLGNFGLSVWSKYVITTFIFKLEKQLADGAQRSHVLTRSFSFLSVRECVCYVPVPVEDDGHVA